MRLVSAGLALASVVGQFAHGGSAVTIGPQNRRSSVGVLGPVTDLEIVNKIIAPDGYFRP